MERDTSSDKFPLGSALPEFSLPAAQGGTVTDAFLRDGKVSLVGFGCNHCPYVRGSEELLNEVVRRFQPQGLKAVVISSNDATKYPEDSFEKMAEKAESTSLPYPYLYDESQQVAKLFDAACTPEFYLFDSSGVLVYHGAINDSPRDKTKVTKEYLAEAISAVLDGRVPPNQFVHPLGCSIKWK